MDFKHSKEMIYSEESVLFTLLFYYAVFNNKSNHLCNFSNSDTLLLISANILMNNFHELAHLIFPHFYRGGD